MSIGNFYSSFGTPAGEFVQSYYRGKTLEILNRLYRIENIKYFSPVLAQTGNRTLPVKFYNSFQQKHRRDYEVKDKIGRADYLRGARYFALSAKKA